jgi:hypothetical protein
VDRRLGSSTGFLPALPAILYSTAPPNRVVPNPHERSCLLSLVRGPGARRLYEHPVAACTAADIARAVGRGASRNPRRMPGDRGRARAQRSWRSLLLLLHTPVGRLRLRGMPRCGRAPSPRRSRPQRIGTIARLYPGLPAVERGLKILARLQQGRLCHPRALRRARQAAHPGA